VALAAEVVGVCQRALDMTLAYVKERKQFGVPVGSFQAVAHRCAEMLLHTESARSAAYFAAWAADADQQLFPEAGPSVTAAAIQMHGGIGFTWEADVHWLYKRAQLDTALLGGSRRHRAALARQAAEKVRQLA
jgi:alkylation response protein AidB-like acyl-CoA dehydrogenase